MHLSMSVRPIYFPKTRLAACGFDEASRLKRKLSEKLAFIWRISSDGRRPQNDAVMLFFPDPTDCEATYRPENRMRESAIRTFIFSPELQVQTRDVRLLSNDGY